MAAATIAFPYTGFDTPYFLAISPDGTFALVTNYGGNNVARIDLQTGNVTFPYTGFNGPCGVAISPDGTFALVVNQGGNNVGRITFPPPPGPIIEDYSLNPVVLRKFDDGALPVTVRLAPAPAPPAARFEISPPVLPEGLIFQAATGTISGVARQECWPPTDFTIVPFGADGVPGSSYTLTLTVLPPVTIEGYARSAMRCIAGVGATLRHPPSSIPHSSRPHAFAGSNPSQPPGAGARLGPGAHLCHLGRELRASGWPCPRRGYGYDLWDPEPDVPADGRHGYRTQSRANGATGGASDPRQWLGRKGVTRTRSATLYFRYPRGRAGAQELIGQLAPATR